MKKLFIVLIAFGAFWLPGVVRRGRAQDSLQYILMIVNQGTQITNQGLALARMDTHIGQLTGQFEHLKESALGQIGAITDPIADLIAVPTDLLNTARDWHSDFTGQAGSLIDALTELDDGTSLSESWRDVLQEADTVSAADIRDIYQSNSNAADAAVVTFERQRDHADRSVVLAHARADAAASLAATAAEVQDKIDTVAGENNVSDTALQQAILAGNLSQGQLLARISHEWCPKLHFGDGKDVGGWVARAKMPAEGSDWAWTSGGEGNDDVKSDYRDSYPDQRSERWYV